MAAAYGARGLPTLAARVTFVIGPDGRVVAVHEGKDALDPAAALESCPLRKRKSGTP